MFTLSKEKRRPFPDRKLCPLPENERLCSFKYKILWQFSTEKISCQSFFKKVEKGS
jgi:hypothetical protein